MKRLLLTAAVLPAALPAQAAEHLTGLPGPRLWLLVGANLFLTVMLLFLLVVIVSALKDRRSARKNATRPALHRESRSPRHLNPATSGRQPEVERATG